MNAGRREAPRRTGPAAPDIESVWRRMHHRDGADTLPGHLERACGIKVAKLTALDAGVFRVDRADDGPPLVARMFAATRPHAAAAADLAVLRYLAAEGFPAEPAIPVRPAQRAAPLILTAPAELAPARSPLRSASSAGR